MTLHEANNPPGEVRLREVSEADIPVFFEQQLDPDANYMAAFTARDPKDWEAFKAHWARITANEASVIRTILSARQIAGYI